MNELAGASAGNSKEQWLAAGPATANSIAAFVPALVGLTQDLNRFLKQNQFRLLSLNRSRREEILTRLQALAGMQPEPTDLATWLTERHPFWSSSVTAFLEEISLVVLGQALVLKSSGADRGIRPIQKSDLSNIQPGARPSSQTFYGAPAGHLATHRIYILGITPHLPYNTAFGRPCIPGTFLTIHLGF